jgi:hypothetical protein
LDGVVGAFREAAKTNPLDDDDEALDNPEILQ